MRKWGKFGTSVCRFSTDGAASTAVKGLIIHYAYTDALVMVIIHYAYADALVMVAMSRLRC